MIFVAGFTIILFANFQLLNNTDSANIDILDISYALVYPKVFIYYYPERPDITNILKSIKVENHLRSMKNMSMDMNKLFKSHLSSLFYVYFFTGVERKTNFSNAVDFMDQVVSITLSMTVKENLQIMSETSFHANYLNGIYLIYSACKASNYSNDIYLSGLPDVIDGPLTWPGAYLMFLFGIMGCFVINYHMLNKSYRCPIVNHTGIYSKLLSLFIIYNVIGLLAHVVFIVMMLFLPGHNILVRSSLLTVILIYTVTYNTGLFTASLIASINADIYKTMFGMTLFVGPQILYVYNSGRNLGKSKAIFFYSPIFPIFSMGWILETLEELESYVFRETNLIEDIQFKHFLILILVLISYHCFFWILVVLIIICRTETDVLGLFKKTFKAIFTHKKPSRSTSESLSTVTSDLSIDSNIKSRKTSINTVIKTVGQFFSNVIQSWNTSNMRHINPMNRLVRRIIPSISRFSSNRLKKKLSIVTKNKQYCLYTKHLFKIFNTNYGSIHALDDLNMSAHKNKITAIVGPNGSGKSTLIKILGGMIYPTSGYVVINTIKIINTIKHKMFSKIATFTNNKIEYEFLSVMEYFQFVLSMSNLQSSNDETLSNINQLINTLDLDNFLMIQLRFCPPVVIRLVQIMSVFLINTPIVLLDEPYIDLDYRSQQLVNRLFLIRKGKQSIILTTSQANNIETCADTVILMFEGKSIFHSRTLTFRKENSFGFKLICFMELNAGDYSVIMFIKSLYPEIKYELSENYLIQFHVPNNLSSKLTQIQNDLLSNAARCGIIKVKINRLNFQSYFHQLCYRLNPHIFKYNEHIEKSLSLNIVCQQSWSREKFFYAYLNQFRLLFVNRLNLLLRNPGERLSSILFPLLTIILLSLFTIAINPYSVYYDSYPEFPDELIIGVSPDSSEFSRKVISKITEKSTTVSIVAFSLKADFYDFLLAFAINDIRKFKLNVKAAISFIGSTNTSNVIVILTNYDNILANIFETILDSMTATSINFDYIGEHVKNVFKTETIEKPFLLRMVLIVIIVFISYLFNQRRCLNFKENKKLLRLVTFHYTMSFLPKYCVDILQCFILNGFLVLITYIFIDFQLMLPDENVHLLVILLTVYELTDVTMKTLIGEQFNFSPSNIMYFIYIDLVMIILSSCYSELHFKRQIKLQGYPYMSDCINMTEHLMFIYIIAFPAMNVANGLVSYLESPTWTNSNQICDYQFFYRVHSGSSISFLFSYIIFLLSIQGIICMILLFVMNHPRFAKLKAGLYYCQVKFNVAQNQPLITINDISYKDQKSGHELKNINWNIKPGTLSMILGPNSAGKSRLLQLILGFKKPKSGNIVYNIKQSEMASSISFCSQRPALIGELSVTELIIFWANIRCISQKKIDWVKHLILNELNLKTYSHKLIKHLSVSTTKKVGLGLSVIGFPSLIVLDDPLANLDPMSQLSVVHLLQMAKARNCTIILTGTEINNIYNLIENVLILKNYEVIYQGLWKDIPNDISIGFYLTIIFDGKMENETIIRADIQRRLELKFEKVTMINQFDNIILYFIPFQNISNVDYSHIVVFIEENIRYNFNIIQYLINFNVFM